MVEKLVKKYIWLLQLFVRAGEKGLTLEQVCSRWEAAWGCPYSRRSFCNHREAILDTFGVEIACDRSSNRYYIASSGDVTDELESTRWLVNTFTVSNLLNESRERLSGRVSVEDIPSGHRWLTEAMEAMNAGEVMCIDYRKYDGSGPSIYNVRPYAVKESARRWYLVGWCEERKAMRVYGMDRIVSMESTGRNFTLPGDFDVDLLFAESYGVYLPEGGPAQEIIFRAGETETRFLSDLPLHHSQKVLSRENGITTFSIRVHPNRSLVMDLMAKGDRIEVIAPESLRTTLREESSRLAALYAKDL